MSNFKLHVLLWLDEKLIPQWERAYQFASVRALGLMGLLTSVWLAVPEDDRVAVATALGINPGYLVLVGVAVAIYKRLKVQPELHDTEKKDQE